MISRAMKVMCAGLLVAHIAHANTAKDVTRMSIGVGAGLAVGYGLQALNNPDLIALGIMDPQVIPGLAAVGALCGAWFTSYGKMLRAQLYLSNVDQQLMDFVTQLTYGKTPEEVVEEMQNYYVNTAYPLITAVETLAKQDNYLGAGIELLQLVVDSMPDDSPRKAELTTWLNNVTIVQTCVIYVLTIIQKDSRYAQMLQGKTAHNLGLSQ